MTSPSFAEVDAVYRSAGSCSVATHGVDHEGFRTFCFDLRDFARGLGELAGDEFWQSFLHRLRRFRYGAVAVPIRFSQLESDPSANLAELRARIAECDAIYPSKVAAAAGLVNRYEALLSDDTNPMLDEVLAQAKSSDAALLLRAAWSVGPVQQVIDAHPELRDMAVVTSAQLRSAKCFESLYVIGPLVWFPEFVRTASRASQIHVVRYGWLFDHTTDEPLFVATTKIRHRKTLAVQASGSQFRGSSKDEATPATDVGIDATELLPRFEWSNASSAGLADGGAEEDDVDARLFLLEDDFGVFLEDDEDSQTTVIDLDQETSLTVRRLPVRDIERGMFVLLRTEGGGDYIPELADRMLGSRAADLRDIQRSWKRQLRIAVKERGAADVCQMLRQSGSPRANEANLRTWMSNRSLRTQNRDDFSALMSLVHLEVRTEEIWNKMGELRVAHQTAGQRVRKLLIEKVQASDFDELQRLGRLDFELPGLDGGTLTAFRIVDIAPEPVLVHASRIGHPISVEATTWHE